MAEHFLQHRIFCNTRWRDSLGVKAGIWTMMVDVRMIYARYVEGRGFIVGDVNYY